METTKAAIDRVCADLGLPSGGPYTQDLAYELPEEFRTRAWLDRYLAAYARSDYGDAEKGLLIDLALDVTNDLLQANERTGSEAWRELIPLLARDLKLHRERLEYWADRETPLEDAFALSPLVRRFLDDQHVSAAEERHEPKRVPRELEYRTGSAFGPAAVGDIVLRLSAEGGATLERRRFGRLEQWRGRIVESSLARLFGALAETSFPEREVWPPPPPDSWMRVLIAGGNEKASVLVPWDEGAKRQGYAEAFRILDEAIGQLSAGAVRIVKDGGTVRVAGAHRVS